MDTTTKKRTATIDTVERLQNTLNGNPQYLVQFTDGAVMYTEPDAGWVYGVSLTYMTVVYAVAWFCFQTIVLGG